MAQRIGVLFGGPSPEHDVSVITGLQATHALRSRGHDTVALYWTQTGDWWRIAADSEPADLADGVPSGAEELRFVLGREGGFFRPRALGRATALEMDAVVNCCHGGPGENGALQGALDLAGVRYTGPSAIGAAIGMDKLSFGAVVGALGLPTLPRAGYLRSAPAAPDFPPPYIVKPRYGGSSIGIAVAGDFDSARALIEHGVHLRDGAVVEPYLDGAEDVNIAVRTFPQLALSAIEKPVRGQGSSHILGFADKYTAEEGMAGAARELPAELPAETAAAIEECARAVAVELPVRGLSRVDFLVDGSDYYVNEVNTIPGSLAKYLWIEPAVAFHDLLEGLVQEALERPTYKPSTEGADGALLRSAGSIASKLR